MPASDRERAQRSFLGKTRRFPRGVLAVLVACAVVTALGIVAVLPELLAVSNVVRYNLPARSDLIPLLALATPFLVLFAKRGYGSRAAIGVLLASLASILLLLWLGRHGVPSLL